MEEVYKTVAAIKGKSKKTTLMNLMLSMMPDFPELPSARNLPDFSEFPKLGEFPNWRKIIWGDERDEK
jgi:hypothetical protein